MALKPRGKRRVGRPRNDDLGEFTIHVTQEIIDRGRREGLSGAQVIALAIQESIPGATEIEVNGQNLSSPGWPSGGNPSPPPLSPPHQRKPDGPDPPPL